MRIIESSRERAVASLIDRRPGRDPRLQRRVAAIVDRVRREGDAALLAYARRFDRLDGPIEVDAGTLRAAAARVDPVVRRAIRRRGCQHSPRRRAPGAARLDDQPGSGRLDRTTRAAARPRRLLRAGGAVPTALFPADDGNPGARCRGAGSHRRLPAAGRHGDGRRGRGRRDAILPDRRRARDRGARLRHGDGPPRRQDRRARQRLRRRGQGLRLARLRDRLLRRADGDCGRLEDRPAGMDRRRSARPGRARPGCARRAHHAEPAARHGGGRGSARARSVIGARAPRRHHRHQVDGGSHRALPAVRTRARRLRRRRCGCQADAGWNGLRRRLQRPGLRRLRDRIESRAADRRRGRGARRPQRRRLRPRLDGAAPDEARLQSHRCRRHHPRGSRRA